MRRFPRLRRFLLRGLAVAGLVLAVLAGVGFSRSALEVPPPSRWITDRDGAFLGVVPGAPDGRLGFWPVEGRLWRVEAALLAIEDRRFWQHPGVDVAAIGRAIQQNLRAGRRVSGASTVAMQVARMQRPAERSWGAKLTEAATAVALVVRHGRRAVLEHYLRLAPYGNEVHGFVFAARWYFDKPAADLSWAEIAFLSAIPQAPGLMNPYTERGRGRARARALRILEALEAQAVITAAEHAEAVNSLERLQIRQRPAREPSTLHALFTLADGDAPRVRTTLDVGLQRFAAAEVARTVDAFAADGAQNAAALVVDLADMGVRAAVGSAGFGDEARDGALDYTRVLRSPGSALKPLLYAQALQDGLIDAASPLDDLQRAQDGIGNADGRFLGPLLPAAALGNSRNVPAVALVERLGVDRVYGLFRRLGLHHDAAPAEAYGLGLALGALPVRLVDVAAATAVLARDGRFAPLRWRMDDPTPAGERVFPAEITRQIQGFLADPQARLPSFPRLGHAELPFPVALKTGSSAGWRDAWTVAWTPRFLVVTWVGRPDWHPMKRVSGYKAAAKLAVALLRHLHPDAHLGMADVGFPPPEGWHAEAVCALSGLAPTAACDRVASVWRPADAPPRAACDQHVAVELDARTGGPATVDTPAALRERRVFVDLPGRYAAWMERAGLRRPPTRIAAGGPAALRQGQRLQVRILSPQAGAELLRNPESPDALGTVALEVAVDPPVPQVLWSVDGAPVALVGPPYATRWVLAPGEHVIEVAVPHTDTRDRVRIVAR
ncbi:MAG: transglycosylase domain-containing protein [Myxococcales bacterium]|nr:transglycosylase domain-containing protein [Myxococcales bacterium]